MSGIIPIDVKKKAKEYRQIKEALENIEYEMLQLNILESKLRQQKMQLEIKLDKMEEEAIEAAHLDKKK